MKATSSKWCEEQMNRAGRCGRSVSCHHSGNAPTSAGIDITASTAATAPRNLSSPLAPAWRIQRGSLMGWSVAFAALGILLGAVGQSVSEILDTPGIDAFLDGMGAENSGDAFLYFIIYIMAQVSSAYVIVSVLKMRSEETSGRADPVLSTAVGRLRWAGSHMFFAVVGPVVMMLGLAIGAVYGLSMGDAVQAIPDYVGTALVKLPAVWVVTGFVFTLYGLLPGLSAYGSWAALDSTTPGPSPRRCVPNSSCSSSSAFLDPQAQVLAGVRTPRGK